MQSTDKIFKKHINSTNLKKIIGLKEEFFAIFDFQFLKENKQIIINQKKIHLPEWFNSDIKEIKLGIFLKNGEKLIFLLRMRNTFSI